MSPLEPPVILRVVPEPAASSPPEGASGNAAVSPAADAWLAYYANADGERSARDAERERQSEAARKVLRHLIGGFVSVVAALAMIGWALGFFR